jgi:hypothetical protein
MKKGKRGKKELVMLSTFKRRPLDTGYGPGVNFMQSEYLLWSRNVEPEHRLWLARRKSDSDSNINVVGIYPWCQTVTFPALIVEAMARRGFVQS